jgi:hypothetical protein
LQPQHHSLPEQEPLQLLLALLLLLGPDWLD